MRACVHDGGGHATVGLWRTKDNFVKQVIFIKLELDCSVVKNPLPCIGEEQQPKRERRAKSWMGSSSYTFKKK